MIIITYQDKWGQILKIETAVLVLGMSKTNIDHVVFLSYCLGNRDWLCQLGWPGQSTQNQGEILYQYNPATIQGKKCSNGVYQNQTWISYSQSWWQIIIIIIRCTCGSEES